tara:strand:+ start:1357 stop:1587 length:231 start_codon:yes stop_codon:yes gene_type:complete
MTKEDNTYETSDIGIAAYLQLKGYKLLVCERGPRGKFHFKFFDPNSECPARSLEFLDSDFCKFDNIVRNLKKILFS